MTFSVSKMKAKTVLRFMLLGGELALVCWLAGFLRFVAIVSTYKEAPIDETLVPTEAIIVLTGGSERLGAGLELLVSGKGKKLLISGVPLGLKTSQVLARHNIPDDLRDCCVVLGHAADNTIGNAEETASFMQAEGFHTLRLVTAHYHMPRSLLLFRTILPDIEIYPYPVAPDSVKLEMWWTRPGTTALLATEYSKYLFAILRDKLEVL